jgi:hypothetical protein
MREIIISASAFAFIIMSIQMVNWFIHTRKRKAEEKIKWS